MINSQPFNDTEGVNYKAKINRLEAELTHTKALNKELIELLNKKNNCRPTETEAANQQKHQEADQAEKTTQTQKRSNHNNTKQNSRQKVNSRDKHDLKMVKKIKNIREIRRKRLKSRGRREIVSPAS